MISKTAIIYPNVELGINCTIEDFCILGCGGPEKTIIGDNATIRAYTIIYHGNVIGNNFCTGNKTNIREFNNIGHDVSIGTLSVIEHHICIGNKVRIHSQAFIPEYSVLEEGCWIGPNVVLTNAKYPNSPNAKQELKTLCVMSKAVIGANSTILPGVTLGKKCVVGAGSVVTKNVVAGDIVVGNPAKVINNIDKVRIYDLV
jgi:acetyltransferase-like isoleucine patch superfamily enzyme